MNFLLGDRGRYIAHRLGNLGVFPERLDYLILSLIRPSIAIGEADLFDLLPKPPPLVFSGVLVFGSCIMLDAAVVIRTMHALIGCGGIIIAHHPPPPCTGALGKTRA